MLQHVLLHPEKNVQRSAFQNDGSLLLLKAENAFEAAHFIAKLLKANTGFRPACFLPVKDHQLDLACRQEGLPGMGILSSSLARPSLQILKLLPTFLWHPLDPFRILEFVTLPAKPLHDDLASAIAGHVSQKPGTFSDSWEKMVRRFFAQYTEGLSAGSEKELRTVRKQYRLWFQRNTYNRREEVPIREIIEMYRYLSEWAQEMAKTTESAFNVLREQANRVCELLERFPQDSGLDFLTLERIIRTVYEPSPLRFGNEESGHLPYFHQAGAVNTDIDTLLWWNFNRHEEANEALRWYPHEMEYMQSIGCPLERREQKNARRYWQQCLPVISCRKQLILVCPANIHGRSAFPHAFHDILISAFTNTETIICDIHGTNVSTVLQSSGFRLSQKIQLPISPILDTQPFIGLEKPAHENLNSPQAITRLERLIYYPHTWFFRQVTKLRKSSLFSIVPENTMLGNLAHRFLELLLENGIEHSDRTQVHAFIEEHAMQVFRSEGAVLLMYGKEPERQAFLTKIKDAAWTLVSTIQRNHWKIVGVEIPNVGNVSGIHVKGKADLLLQRGDELLLVDFKWRGARRRQQELRNKEDLQLVLYGSVAPSIPLKGEEQPAKKEEKQPARKGEGLPAVSIPPFDPNGKWVHTAYFIISESLFIARNTMAIKECIAVAPQADHHDINKEIYQCIEKTLQWRKQQLAQGMIEIRTAQTAPDLDEIYGEELMELLEMKGDDFRFDDYATLV